MYLWFSQTGVFLLAVTKLPGPNRGQVLQKRRASFPSTSLLYSGTLWRARRMEKAKQRKKTQEENSLPARFFRSPTLGVKGARRAKESYGSVARAQKAMAFYFLGKAWKPKRALGFWVLTLWTRLASWEILTCKSGKAREPGTHGIIAREPHH